MISVEYLGRLGNNMFQYALGRIVAERYAYRLDAAALPGFPQSATEVDGRMESRQPLVINDFNFSWELLDAAVASGRKIILRGFFQNWAILKPYENQLKEWYSPEGSRLDCSSSYDVVFHVRRTDMVAFSGAVSVNYIQEAMRQVNPERNTVLVCTDDSNDPFFKRWGVKLEFCSGSAMEDYELMFNARKLVISASSFGWWPAILGDHEMVVAPRMTRGDWRVSGSTKLLDEERFLVLSGDGWPFFGWHDFRYQLPLILRKLPGRLWREWPRLFRE